MICHGHWVLHLGITHGRGATIRNGLCILHLGISHTRQGYDLRRTLGSVSCDITHDTKGTIYYVYWVPYLDISLTKEQGLRFVTGIGFCIWGSHTDARL